MSIENARKSQEYLQAIDEIDRFLNLFNPCVNYICLENAQGKKVFHISYASTLEAIEKTLNQQKEEYYKMIEKL